MEYSTPAHVRELVKSYCKEVKGGTASFTISERIGWNDPPPPAANAGGCYAIYTSDDALIYVGMSEKNVADRIARHRKTAAAKVPFWEVQPPITYQLILNLDPWDAAGLEIYLTRKSNRQNLLR
ncbi:GIY-YIG nuclease family protein [uncultured Sphingomonas sp.]|uniref:GIY-YIG nuclease family protein n=1 Tax=uncultured Sphingomonas sp. TaxID=158754 RepID=UPI00258AD68D|nr:GIY-YIG nuclease family protein [uncultured Sphingomonas sp.]